MVWEWIVGGSAAAVGLVSYVAYRSFADTADALEEVPRFTPDARLQKKLGMYREGTIPFAAVRGEVRPVQDSLKCGDDSERQECVVRQRIRKEHKSVYVSTTEQWHSRTNTVSNIVHEVPLALHGCASSKYDANGVKVKSPRDARELPMYQIRERFEPVQNTNTVGIVTDYLVGEKLMGYQEIESALPVGVVLTGIGELSVRDGKVTLCAPGGRLPFFLTERSVEELITSQRAGAKGWKVLFYICALVGGACLLFRLYRWWMSWRQRQRSRREATEFAHRQAELRRQEGREHGNDATRPDQPTTCVVCWENTPDVVLLNCGHLCSCSSCVTSLSRCPLCRSEIERFVPVFASSHT